MTHLCLESGHDLTRGCWSPSSILLLLGMAGGLPKDIPEPKALLLSPGYTSPPPGFFKDLEQELHQHQERRQQAALTEHLSRMETQPVLTDLPLLPAVPMAGDCSSTATDQPGKESAPKATSSTQTASSTKKQVSKNQKSSVQARKGALAATTSKTSQAATPSMTKMTNKKSTK